jgi:hypothetical protein
MVSHALLRLRSAEFIEGFNQHHGPTGNPKQLGERPLLTAAVRFNGMGRVNNVNALIRERN